ncbi:hypothetical protein EMIT07CA2_550126 [Brevibacillus sp. IT-7CA2]|uniref:hypothetical protein n=1 Tax=Brevibacillus sp. IT-7CA2 TaxID=3026436 RepID=UPI0039DF9932
MKDKQAALKEIRQAISEIAITNDNSVGPVNIYRPRSLREGMAEEKSMIEEQNRERIERLRSLRNSLVKS